MTRIIITLLVSILSFLVNAQEIKTDLTTSKEGVTINVTVTNATTDKGKVYFALFNSKESFNQGAAFQNVIGEIKENKTSVSFINVPKGLYAITCYHDANDNKKMDFDGMMPIEDFGSSNNPSFYGPPQFEASRFEVSDTDLQLEIRF